MGTEIEINEIIETEVKLNGWYLADFRGEKQGRLIYVKDKDTIVFMTNINGQPHFRSLEVSKDYYVNWVKISNVKIVVN